MNVIFRTDASVFIGTGHVMRCLTLASELQAKGAWISFICRELPGNLCVDIENKGFNVYRLPNSQAQWSDNVQNTKHAQWLGVEWYTDARQTKVVLEKESCIDWLIVDHYAIDKQWEMEIRPYVRKMMVIDDLADRSHDCDVLLDQNLYENMENRYKGLVPRDCVQLLGPRHALIRSEFIAERVQLRKRTGDVRCIFIFFGGIDPTNETAKSLEAIRLMNRSDVSIDVVVGKAHPYKGQIMQLCSTLPNTTYYCQVQNMAQLMAKADLAIGAVGTAAWERCFLGLPAITLIIASNQVEVTESLAIAGVVWNLGWNTMITPELLHAAINKLMHEPNVLKKMGEKALRLMATPSDSERSIVNLIMTCGGLNGSK